MLCSSALGVVGWPGKKRVGEKEIGKEQNRGRIIEGKREEEENE